MSSDFAHSFPAARGVQAGRACYIAMCPLRLIPKIFLFDEDEVPAELRAQRRLNTLRVPEITQYLLDNPSDYTLSALTASVNAKVRFEPSQDTGLGQNLGILHIPMDAQILINDGQHRRAAIEFAIEANPELGLDHIPVLFFIDEGLQKSQQMFTDLNKHAVRPSDSLTTLYDRRDALSGLARAMIEEVSVFTTLTEKEKSSISNRSTKLFTLSAIKNATKALLSKMGPLSPALESEKEIAARYWNAVAKHMPDWQLALHKKVSTAELREQYIHAHGVVLQALGNVGAELIQKPEPKWAAALKKLEDIDWSRSNPCWNGRAIHNGRISKATTSVTRTSNYLKLALGMQLSESEQRLEGNPNE